MYKLNDEFGPVFGSFYETEMQEVMLRHNKPYKVQKPVERKKTWEEQRIQGLHFALT